MIDNITPREEAFVMMDGWVYNNYGRYAEIAATAGSAGETTTFDPAEDTIVPRICNAIRVRVTKDINLGAGVSSTAKVAAGLTFPLGGANVPMARQYSNVVGHGDCYFDDEIPLVMPIPYETAAYGRTHFWHQVAGQFGVLTVVSTTAYITGWRITL